MFSITRQEYEGTNAWCSFCERRHGEKGIGFYCKKTDHHIFPQLCEDIQCKKKGKGGTIYK